MNRLDTMLEEFLEKTGRLTTSKMGGELLSPKPVTDELRNLLTNNLIKESRFNRILIISILAMFVLLFGLGIFFAIYYRNDPKTMAFIFGGTFLTLLGTIKGLQLVWNQKTKADLLIPLISNVPPDQVAGIIETLVYESKAKTSSD